MTDRAGSIRVRLVPPATAGTMGTKDDRPPAVTFERIFEAEFDYVWNSLYRLGVHERDLEDVTHDVFLDVHRRFADYDPDRHIRPWLFAFAFRAASDYRRRARHRREIMVEADSRDAAPLADEQLASQDDRRLVRAALEKIALDRRAVFIAHDIDGSAIPEIAESLCIPVNTAYSRLRLARSDFAEAVARLRGQPRKR
jgi:RNA polymerase sigma-70 factor, ECF subfamily